MRMERFVIIKCPKCGEEVEITEEGLKPYGWAELVALGLTHGKCGGKLVRAMSGVMMGLKPKIDGEKTSE